MIAVEYPRDEKTGLPLCDRCHKPVTIINDAWHHYYTDDLHGPCWWGKPFPFGELGPGVRP